MGVAEELEDRSKRRRRGEDKRRGMWEDNRRRWEEEGRGEEEKVSGRRRSLVYSSSENKSWSIVQKVRTVLTCLGYVNIPR